MAETQAIKDGVYTPSVPEENELKRNYQPISEKSAQKRHKMGQQMHQIAVLLEQRRIVPENKDDYKQLLEQELASADTKGVASTSVFKTMGSTEEKDLITPASLHLMKSKRPDGQYDMLEFAEIMARGANHTQSASSKNGDEPLKDIGSSSSPSSSSTVSRKASEATRRREADIVSTSTSFHRHQSRQTKFTMMPHHDTNNYKIFKEDPNFVYGLFGSSGTALATLMRCSQHDSAEEYLDDLRFEKKQKACKTASGWVDSIKKQTGIHLFCAYTPSDLNRVSFVFCADNANRYFLVMVLKLKDSSKRCIDEARDKWSPDSLKEYRERIENTETARDTRNPCIEKRKNGHESELLFWATFDITLCNSLCETKFVFDYAYYTACQCVDLEK